MTAHAQTNPLSTSTPEQELARAETYLRSFKNDSALAIASELVQALKTQGKLDTPFGIRVQLAEATAVEQDQQSILAMKKLLHVAQQSRAKRLWDTHTRACLALALLHEKIGRKENAREQLDLAKATIDAYGLMALYPYYAIRMASWQRIYNRSDSALFYAREARRTAPQHQLVLEEAISHMLLSMLLPRSARAERLQACREGVQLYRQLGDHVGHSSMLLATTKLYVEQKNFRQALAYSDSTLAADRQAIATKQERHEPGYTYQLRGEIYEQLGQLDSALLTTRKGYQLALAASHADMSDKVAEVDARYQTKLRQRQVVEQQMALRLKNNQLGFSVAIAGLVLLLAGGLYRAYRKQWHDKQLLADQKRLVEQQATQLAALDAAKTRLFTNISHEFRTPLTVINGLAAQLGQSANANTQESATLIGRNGENLLHLVNQILDLAQIDNGSMPIDWVHGNIVTYLQYLTESFYSLAQQREIRLVFYSEQPTLLMDFDAGKLQTILTNLVGNALKFTPRQGRIVIHATVLSGTLAGSQLLKLNVQDTGSGIAEDELPHIFDRFYQADESSTRRNEGTGIGLALVYELTTLLGGGIAAESRVGKGTTFTLTLPIQQRDPEATLWEPAHTLLIKAEPDVPTPATYLPPTATDKPLLLLIEDNADVATYISGLLQRDYQVVWADNGRVGIERAWDIVPDIVISDVMMPEKDGYDVCHTLKTDERSSHIPIILLTAKATQADKLTGLKTGADAYLEKPFQTDELFVHLNNLVSLRKRLQSTYSQTIRLTAPLPKPVGDDSLPAPTLDEQFLAKINTVIADHIDNPDLSVGHLCDATNLSNTQVFRKLKALTGLNPTLYVRRQRLERAVGLLQNPALNVAEVAYAVGFADPNYFSRAFAETFGHPPDFLRKRLKTNAV